MNSRWSPKMLVPLTSLAVLLSPAGMLTAQAPFPDAGGSPPADKSTSPRDSQVGPGDSRSGFGAPPPAGMTASLRDTYDDLNTLSFYADSDKLRLAAEDARLLEASKALYRTALRTTDDRKAVETALAAREASRGLLLLYRAGAPAVEGLPAPPEAPVLKAAPPPPPATPPSPGEVRPPRDVTPPPPPHDANPPPPAAESPRAGGTEAVVRGMLRELHDRAKDEADRPVAVLARPFVNASQRAADAAQLALDDKDYGKALKLVLAADAWSHVNEHLRRAETAPEGRRDLPPPRRSDLPPPPPAPRP